MAISAKCACGAQLRVGPQHVGKPLKCPRCLHTLLVTPDGHTKGLTVPEGRASQVPAWVWTGGAAVVTVGLVTVFAWSFLGKTETPTARATAPTQQVEPRGESEGASPPPPIEPGEDNAVEDQDPAAQIEDTGTGTQDSQITGARPVAKQSGGGTTTTGFGVLRLATGEEIVFGKNQEEAVRRARAEKEHQPAVQRISDTLFTSGGQTVTWKGRVAEGGKIIGESDDSATSYEITVNLRSGMMPPKKTQVVVTGLLKPGVLTGTDYAYRADGSRTAHTTYYVTLDSAEISEHYQEQAQSKTGSGARATKHQSGPPFGTPPNFDPFAGPPSQAPPSPFVGPPGSSNAVAGRAGLRRTPLCGWSCRDRQELIARVGAIGKRNLDDWRRAFANIGFGVDPAQLLMGLPDKGVLFQGARYRGDVHTRLVRRVSSISYEELSRWRGTIAESYPLAGCPDWSVAVTVAAADPFYGASERYDPRKAGKYLQRLRTVSRQDIDLFNRAVFRSAASVDDAAISLVLSDAFFQGDRFNRQAFHKMLPR